MSCEATVLILCGVVATLTASSAPVTSDETSSTVYVAPEGNDAWSGRLSKPNRSKTDGPLATLGKAREAARAFRARGKASSTRIVVRGGRYFVDSVLVLTAEDSGLTIEAAAREKPVLYGGCRLTGWQREGDKLWSADLPRIHQQALDFRHLVVNGHLCQRARLPETGAFSHVTEFKVPWMSTTGGGWQRKPTHEELTTMRYKPGDLGDGLDLKNAELTIFHVWDESMVGLAGHDVGTQTLRFSNPAGHPPGAFGVQKYVVWNVREGMCAPGQWYLDRTSGKVVYWPLPGEDMSKAEVIAPAVESLIRIQGSKEVPVKNVNLKGLTFSVTNTPLKAGGFGASAFGGAASVQFATDCNLVNLTFRNVGGQGLKGHGCNRLRVENCEMENVGACGIKVDGVDTVVSNNYVHHIGVAYPSAIAVWVDGQRAEVSHNEIHDTPYTAIAAGGTDHRIESNLIYRAMQVLHDGAGIYITFCKGIVVRGNYIHDILDT
ncbi:MAG: right-handed parallel beta-helix repeat-containing protein, partial [Armatimonadetes bacterium]|nr:right-handed parallel beta-helix repeat-containing protein [Armatimonadota bacterium]